MAERHVVHLTRLIDDLMDVARISRGKIELHKQVVDLATVVNHAVQTSRHLLLERRHLLTLTLPEEAHTARGRPHPVGAGFVEPLEQRDQVYRTRRPDRSLGRA